MLKKVLARLAEGHALTLREASRAMDSIMDGEAEDAQIAGFAMALLMKGETTEEIVGCVRALRRRAVPMEIPGPMRSRLVDTCGTGGDRLGTINVSTLSAIVAAGAGLQVAKHGNRSVSSLCGSADLLEALGVTVDLPPARAVDCLRKTGLAFLHAPGFHPALRQASAARRALGMRTVFNLLGPLCNPAGARRQVIGVYAPDRLPQLALVLRTLGVRRAMLVHGVDGMDEVTVTGPTRAVEVSDAGIRGMTITPESAGLRRWPAAALRGGGPERNAAIATRVLDGAPGAARDITLLNAAAALKVGGMARTWRDGVTLAAASIDTGAAAGKLAEVRAQSKGISRAGGAIE